MAEAMSSLAELTLADFTARLASAEPTPGGGSASAVAGSMGAALVVMVARLSQGRPRYERHAPTHERAVAAGEAAMWRFLDLADRDAIAYQAYVAALRMPHASEAEAQARRSAVALAARDATAAPVETIRLCEPTMALVEALAGRSNVNAASDLDVAASLLSAAAAGAAANVRINLAATDDPAFAAATDEEVLGLEEAIHHEGARIHELVASGEMREPEAE